MKAIIGDCYADIKLTTEEFKEHCKPGMGADTCIWVLVGADGFECSYYNKPYYLWDRWQAGLTVAKRDGCEKVKNFDQLDSEAEIEF